MAAQRLRIDSVLGAASPEARRAPPVLQRVWEPAGADELRWDPLRSGLRWYYKPSTRTMRFEKEGKDAPAAVDGMVGNAMSYRAWIKQWESKEWLSTQKSKSLRFDAYASHIAEAYPAAQYSYIGVGASCDLVLTYLNRRHGIPSASIPISGLTGIPRDRKSWGASEEKAVTDYVTAFVPGSMLGGDKKLLLMDVTDGGNSLNVMGDLMKDVLRTRGSDPDRVTLLSLNKAVSPDRELTVRAGGGPGAVPPALTAKRPLAAGERSRGIVPAGAGLTGPLATFLEGKEKRAAKRKKTALMTQIAALTESGGDTKALEGELAAVKKLLRDGRVEHDVIGYDRMVTDENSIEQDLLNQAYKEKLGRLHRKVDIKKIMAGGTTAEAERSAPEEKNTIGQEVDGFLANLGDDG